jgi:hypothetical protein
MTSISTALQVETRDFGVEASRLLTGFWSHQRDRPKKSCLRPRTRDIFMYQRDLTRPFAFSHYRMFFYAIKLENLFHVPNQKPKHGIRSG